MVVLYVIAGIVALFAILLSFNVSVRVIFNSSAKENLDVSAKIGFYKIYIVSQKPRREKRSKKFKKDGKKKEKPAKVEKEKKEKSEGKKKYTIPEIFDFVRNIGTALLKKTKKHFKVKIYNIEVILASEEAEKTALLYGTAIQSAYYLYEFLNYNFKIYRKPDSIKIIPDFSKIQTSFNINIKFYIRLSHLIGLLIASAYKFLKFSNKTGKVET